VFARDMERMLSFYRGTLGMAPAPGAQSMPDWQVLHTGGVELALHGIPAEFARDIQISEPPEPRSAAVTKLVFKVEDLETARRELIGAGAIELQQPALNLPGQRVRCDFLDPEGNIFQISSQ
jgi:predicted enzyme related to lactoylglutathione lyase